MARRRRSGRETPPREAGRSEGTECRCVPEPGRRGENGRGPRGERRRMRARAVRRLLRRVHWIITGSFTGLVTGNVPVNVLLAQSPPVVLQLSTGIKKT